MIGNNGAQRRSGSRPLPTVRRAVRAAAAGAALSMVLAGALAGTAGAATARPAAHHQPGQGLRVTIGSVSPDIGRPGKTVTVSGEVTNDGPGTAQGITAFLRSSGNGLQFRGELDEYANGSYNADQQVSPAVALPDLRPGHSEQFRMSFRPDNAGIGQFGVYPLAAEVGEATGSVATARTFLPFWPGSQPGTQPLQVAWLWPLIDQPRQGACPALVDNTLPSSLDASSGGRLGGLLQAGRSDGAGAKITWAVDPALLADVSAMTGPYHVINGPNCRNERSQPASGTARQWLASLSSTVSQAHGNQPVFATPYADVDVSALTHAGLDNDLASAFTAGQSTATSVLGQHLDKAGGGTVDSTAWPPGGLADSSVLDNLAVNGVRTAVIDGNEMPPAGQIDYTPDAVTKVHTGVGSDVRVLLSDDTLTNVLGGSGAAADSSAAQTEQWFLAETAMIVAEAPNLARSVVVAPPQRWSPSASLAAGLLSETASAPWLKPEYLDNLTKAASPASVTPTPLPPRQVSSQELSSSYLSALRPIDASAQRFNSILSRPDPLFAVAMARAESSAWRGGGQEAGQDLTAQVGRYVSDQEAKVRLINSPGVTLSGARGNVPVSITNQLPRGYTATVKLEASASTAKTVPANKRLIIGNSSGPFVQTVTIRAGESTTVRLPVHAQSAGLTQVDLRLLTPQGDPLSTRPTVLKVQSTPLGLVAEVIIAVAVGVLVITSIIRVIRRGLREGRPAPPGSPQPSPGLGAEADAGPAAEPDADVIPGGALVPEPPGGTYRDPDDTDPSSWPTGLYPEPGSAGTHSEPASTHPDAGAAGAFPAPGPADAYREAGPTGAFPESGHPAGFPDPWPSSTFSDPGPAAAYPDYADTQPDPEPAGTYPHPGPANGYPDPGSAEGYPDPGPADDGFSSGRGSGQEAGTVVTEDGRAGNQHAQHFPEEPDEFADARSRAWPKAP